MGKFKVGDLVKFVVDRRPQKRTVYLEIVTVEEKGYRVIVNGSIAYYTKLFLENEEVTLASSTENILYVQ